MSDAIYQATSGALIQQYRMEILSNNLANVNTVGFKEDRAHFKLLDADPIYPSDPTAEARSGIEPVLLGNPSLDSYVNFSQGAMQHTGNPLDMAIQGDGFFNIQTPQGVQYTRKGNFLISDEGRLVTAEGFPLLGKSGPIQIDEGAITIDKDGGIQVDGSQVDEIRISRFSNLRQLQKVGESRFRALDGNASAVSSESFELRQGYVERGNVDPIRGMVEMIEALRVFEAYQKILETLDEVNAQTVSEVGTVA